jgi:hypothetical protein
MSTRSVIAFVAGDTWKGRYCHGNGYPSYQLVELQKLVNRDGIDTVLKRTTEDRYGWSSISADTEADVTLPGGHSDGRFVSEPGYGTAYTTHQNQSAEDEWVTSDPASDWGTEWCYVLTRKDILVLENGYEDGWREVARVAYDDAITDEMLTDMTCGKNLERCGHVASYHFPAVQSRIGLAAYMGTEEPRQHDAYALLQHGVRYIAQGSGGTGSAQSHDAWKDPSWRDSPRAVHYWWAYVTQEGTDSYTWMRTARITKAGFQTEVAHVFETVDGDVIASAGTVLK